MKCDIGSNCLSALLLVLCAVWCVTSGSDWLQSDVADNSGLGVTYNWYKMRQGPRFPTVHIDEARMKAENTTTRQRSLRRHSLPVCFMLKIGIVYLEPCTVYASKYMYKRLFLNFTKILNHQQNIPQRQMSFSCTFIHAGVQNRIFFFNDCSADHECMFTKFTHFK